MEPAGDLTTGDFCTIVAFAISTTQLQMHNVQTAQQA